MEKNVGGYDRIGRFVIGAVLVVAGAVGIAGEMSLAVGPLSTVVVGALLALVGVVLLVTGATQTCPINSVVGLNTYDPRR
jgi:hypothetical protein